MKAMGSQESEKKEKYTYKQGCEGGGGERGEKRVEYVEGEMDESEGGVWVCEE